MQELNGKTAIITGAGSGFGRQFALACAAEGMQLALSDINAQGLEETAALLPDTEILSLPGDVGDAAYLDTLAEETYARFGAAHLLFNNAGIAFGGPMWTATLEEWDWMLKVNLMGVVHGIRSFVPRMLAQGEPAHIVNTASVAGMLSVPGSSVYCATKHAVVAITECLHHELQMMNAPIGVSVLCPAFVTTGIADCEGLRPSGTAKNPHPLTKSMDDFAKLAVQKAKVTAEEVAQQTLAAVKENRFYILTHPKIKSSIEGRMRHILDGLPPHNTMMEKAG